MMKIKLFVVGAALTASAFLPAIAEARASWT
jgi:hypothetical protein